MLEIKSASKRFGTKSVLNQLSLHVYEGSVFGLVGVNGAGKSTLLRSVAGIYQLDEGEVIFNGSDTYKDNRSRQNILLISDDPYYPKAATIETMKEFYETFYTFDEVRFNKYLDVFKLDRKEEISHFSKGMKRQTSLLFALAIHPRLLLLDEAFDGLDPIVRYTFKKALTELLEDENITVIISSHNLKELEDICDSYGILENGKIETYGDLLESKDLVNKYQIAFDHPMSLSDFEGFDILHSNISGRVNTLVIQGEREEVEEKLNAMNPLFVDVLPVNFEELFIYHVEGTKHE